MPYRTLIIIGFLVTAWFSPCTATPAKKIKTSQHLVVIDPGHGGRNPGVSNSAALVEKDITLLLSKKLAAHLDAGYNVVLTRNTDQTLTAEQRVSKANALKADLFISIHLGRTGSLDGLFYYYDLADAGTKASNPGDWKTVPLSHLKAGKKLAKTLVHFFSSGNDVSSYHVQGAPLRVLQGAAMPCVLIEPVLISNLPADRGNLETVLDRLAEKIAQGIDFFLKESGR